MPALFGANGGSATTSDLYVLDETDGTILATVGPIGYALTGLAWDPVGEVLYGATSQNSAEDPVSLITVDIETGEGTFVGEFVNATMNDIACDSSGNLFGWTVDGDDLYSINKATGLATLVGNSGLTSTFGNGLDFNNSDVLYLFPDGNDGTYYTVNTGTGIPSSAGTLSGSPGNAGSAISAASWNHDTDVLYAVVNSTSTQKFLVTIDESTGVITSMGLSTVTRLDAIGWVDSGSGPPVNTVAPSISPGSAYVDVELTADPGDWTGEVFISFAYQWQRCDSGGGSCVDIGGETNSTYTVTSADLGSTLRVKVTATNGAGSTDAFSPVSIVVTNFPDNDDWANIITITGASGSWVVDNQGYTLEAGEPLADWAPGLEATAWYRWTCPSSGVYTFWTTPGNISPENDFPYLAIYETAGSLAGLTFINGSIDGLSGYITLDIPDDGNAHPVFSFQAQAATTYDIQAGGDGAQGTFTFHWDEFTPPTNDDLANAITLSGDSGTTPSFTLAHMTIEDGEPTDFSGALSLETGSIWFEWTPTTTGSYRFRTGTSPWENSLRCQVFQGTITDPADLGTLTEIDEFSLPVEGDFPATGGQTYTVRIITRDNDAGYDNDLTNPVTFEWLPTPPPNDDFSDAVFNTTYRLDSGETISATNVNATKETGEPNHAGNAGGASVWYWMGGVGGSVTITVNATFAPLLAVYTGNSVSSLTPVVSATGPANTNVSVTFTASPSTSYRIAVDGFGGAEGTFSVTAEVSAPNGSTLATAIPLPSQEGGDTSFNNTNAFTSQTVTPKRYDQTQSATSFTITSAIFHSFTPPRDGFYQWTYTSGPTRPGIAVGTLSALPSQPFTADYYQANRHTTNNMAASLLVWMYADHDYVIVTGSSSGTGTQQAQGTLTWEIHSPAFPEVYQHAGGSYGPGVGATTHSPWPDLMMPYGHSIRFKFTKTGGTIASGQYTEILRWTMHGGGTTGSLRFWADSREPRLELVATSAITTALAPTSINRFAQVTTPLDGEPMDIEVWVSLNYAWSNNITTTNTETMPPEFAIRVNGVNVYDEENRGFTDSLFGLPIQTFPNTIHALADHFSGFQLGCVSTTSTMTFDITDIAATDDPAMIPLCHNLDETKREIYYMHGFETQTRGRTSVQLNPSALPTFDDIGLKGDRGRWDAHGLAPRNAVSGIGVHTRWIDPTVVALPSDPVPVGRNGYGLRIDLPTSAAQPSYFGSLGWGVVTGVSGNTIGVGSGSLPGPGFYQARRGAFSFYIRIDTYPDRKMPLFQIQITPHTFVDSSSPVTIQGCRIDIDENGDLWVLNSSTRILTITNQNFQNIGAFLPLGSFHHVEVLYDAYYPGKETLKLRINGAEWSFASNTLQSPPSGSNVGRHYDLPFSQSLRGAELGAIFLASSLSNMQGGARNFQAYIDDVVWYDPALYPLGGNHIFKGTLDEAGAHNVEPNEWLGGVDNHVNLLDGSNNNWEFLSTAGWLTFAPCSLNLTVIIGPAGISVSLPDGSEPLSGPDNNTRWLSANAFRIDLDSSCMDGGAAQGSAMFEDNTGMFAGDYGFGYDPNPGGVNPQSGVTSNVPYSSRLLLRGSRDNMQELTWRFTPNTFGLTGQPRFENDPVMSTWTEYFHHDITGGGAGPGGLQTLRVEELGAHPPGSWYEIKALQIYKFYVHDPTVIGFHYTDDANTSYTPIWTPVLPDTSYTTSRLAPYPPTNPQEGQGVGFSYPTRGWGYGDLYLEWKPSEVPASPEFLTDEVYGVRMYYTGCTWDILDSANKPWITESGGEHRWQLHLGSNQSWLTYGRTGYRPVGSQVTLAASKAWGGHYTEMIGCPDASCRWTRQKIDAVILRAGFMRGTPRASWASTNNWGRLVSNWLDSDPPVLEAVMFEYLVAEPEELFGPVSFDTLIYEGKLMGEPQRRLNM